MVLRLARYSISVLGLILFSNRLSAELNVTELPDPGLELQMIDEPFGPVNDIENTIFNQPNAIQYLEQLDSKYDLDKPITAEQKIAIDRMLGQQISLGMNDSTDDFIYGAENYWQLTVAHMTSHLLTYEAKITHKNVKVLLDSLSYIKNKNPSDYERSLKNLAKSWDDDILLLEGNLKRFSSIKSKIKGSTELLDDIIEAIQKRINIKKGIISEDNDNETPNSPLSNKTCLKIVNDWLKTEMQRELNFKNGPHFINRLIKCEKKEFSLSFNFNVATTGMTITHLQFIQPSGLDLAAPKKEQLKYSLYQFWYSEQKFYRKAEAPLAPASKIKVNDNPQ